MSKKKVVIGLSGGVDSAVGAWLLKEQGYEVYGVTMLTWREEEPVAEDAAKVAKTLGIEHDTIDFRKEFGCKVMDYLTEEYLRGKTPNPCVICNRHVKWNALMAQAKKVGADFVATGHYARIIDLPNGRKSIRNAVTAKKDQTYALFNLTQEQLACTLMPVGEYEKEQIRKIAQEQGIPVADKPDSQEICFIPDQDYAGFILSRGSEVPEGNFVLSDGTVLGKHKGIIHYTVGQRKGLGLSCGHPVFVKGIRPDTNEVVIGEEEEIFGTELTCTRMNYMAVEELTEPVRVLGRVRYGHKGTLCEISRKEDGSVRCMFDEPVRAITPGQAAVFYKDDYIFCGGIIV